MVTSNHGTLTWREMVCQRRYDVACAHDFKYLVLHWAEQIVVDSIKAEAIVSIDAFARVETAPCFEPMLEMELAVLQVPTPGSAGLFDLNLPQTDEAFLHQIFLHGWIGIQPADDLTQRLANSGVLETSTGYCAST